MSTFLINKNQSFLDIRVNYGNLMASKGFNFILKIVFLNFKILTN